MKKVLSLLIKICIITAIVYFLYAKVEVRIFRALGTSMDSTIFNTDGSPAIKRIVGLPNEKIDIKEDGKVYISDKVYNESYISSKTPRGEITYPHTVKEDSYFVIGDNRLDSYDSRYTKIGDVNKGRIRGRVVFSLTRLKIVNRINY